MNKLMKGTRKISKRGGFSLLDIIIAVAIISIVGFAALSSLTTITLSNIRVSQNKETYNVAKDVAEQIIGTTSVTWTDFVDKFEVNSDFLPTTETDDFMTLSATRDKIYIEVKIEKETGMIEITAIHDNGSSDARLFVWKAWQPLV